MGEFYKIHPIPLCKIKVDQGIFTYLRNHGTKVWAPTYAWLIEGGEEPILVDTGCTAEEYRKVMTMAEEVEDIASIEESLQRLGISMSDVKTIIMTHLDKDHILNAKKFPNAKLIVQELELRFARNPHPLFYKKYPRHLHEGLNFEIVRGDTEIISGVKAIFTPGHSAGGQSVAVTTELGQVVIAGFCTIDKNFSEQEDIIPASHHDPFKAYDSNLKIRKIADTIIALHSQRTLGIETIP